VAGLAGWLTGSDEVPAPVPDIGEVVVPWESVALAEVERSLDGLGFDEFIEASYRLHVLRHPQNVTVMGKAAEYGVRNNGLDDYSHEYALETFAIERAILDRLRAFDPATLSEQQRTTLEVCEWFWEDEVRGQPFRDFEHLIAMAGPFSALGYLEYVLNSAHPFSSEADVVDYLARLRLVGTQLDQIIAEAEKKRALGIVPPRWTLEQALPEIERLMSAESLTHPYYATLESKGAAIDGISKTAFDRHLMAALSSIDEIVKPAYERLHREVQELLTEAPEALSIGQYEGGGDAYAYLLRHHTQTELTAAEIHELGLRDVARVQDEIRRVAVSVGIEDTDSIAAIIEAAAEMSKFVEGDEAISAAERIIDDAEQLLIESGALSRLPSAEVVVQGVPYGGFYSPAAKDGSRPAAFLVTTAAPSPMYMMPNIAYHEAVPGHHIQNAWAQELDLPLLRRDVMFTGFVEGWALYSERLMSELGAYADDPLGDLGRLRFELLRAVRLVVDTGIHAMGWGYDEASAYADENTGRRGRTGVNYEILRYTVIPGQATAYMVGMHEILELREMARSALGDDFDLAAFHDVILGNGIVPLTFLRDLVDEWMVEEQR
ncbi:DUF885 family protein, partial [Candidatus Bipolaricaulota bacterium]